MVAQAVHEGRVPGVQIVAVAGSGAASASARETAALVNARVVEPRALAGRVDWVVEAAGASAVHDVLPTLWGAGVHTVVMSIGAMLDPEVERAAARFRAAGGRIVLPSGAIAGLDGVRAMAAGGGLTAARITTTKAPAGLEGAPYLEERGIELPPDAPKIVFQGNAREAARGFPANVNVAAALSLAGIGPDLTQVVIRSDPSAQRTVHEVIAEGDSAELSVRLRLEPSALNPRTSYLAALSAVAALRDLAGA